MNHLTRKATNAILTAHFFSSCFCLGILHLLKAESLCNRQVTEGFCLSKIGVRKNRGRVFIINLYKNKKSYWHGSQQCAIKWVVILTASFLVIIFCLAFSKDWMTPRKDEASPKRSRLLNKRATNPNTPRTAEPAELQDSWLLCPKCGRPLARAYYDAVSKGIEIKCRCGAYVLIKIWSSGKTANYKESSKTSQYRIPAGQAVRPCSAVHKGTVLAVFLYFKAVIT